MTPEQLRHYINELASSGREQSASGNFGVGAKVAAGSRNPHGLEYRTWHEGQGTLVRFMRHRDGRWGLAPQQWPNGHTDFWRPLGEHDKPWLLRGQSHGTQVVLLGQHRSHDTTQAPESVRDARQQWITRYLNGRFLRLTEQVEVLVREHHGRDQPGQLGRIHGARHHLEQRAQAAGAVALSDAIVHWWVLDDDHRGRRRESGVWASSGHAAAVFGDELYDVLPQTRGGYGRLQDFGIRFGYEKVVVHVEPQVPDGRLQANTARTLLLLDHEPLPWARWGEEFAAAMPEEIVRLQDRVANTDGIPRQDAIRRRVASILPLYRLSRYRPAQPPRRSSTQPATGDRDESPARTPLAVPAAPNRPPATGAQDTSVDAESLPALGSGKPPTEGRDNEDRADAIVNLPDVAWISARDGHPRARRSRRPSRPLPPRPPRAHHQRRLPRDQRPDRPLAPPLPGSTGCPRRNRSPGT